MWKLQVNFNEFIVLYDSLKTTLVLEIVTYNFQIFLLRISQYHIDDGIFNIHGSTREY